MCAVMSQGEGGSFPLARSRTEALRLHRFRGVSCAGLCDLGGISPPACASLLCSRIFPVQTLEFTKKGTAAASVFLRVVQRIVRVLVDAVAGIGAIGERGACAQRYLRHAIDGLR